MMHRLEVISRMLQLMPPPRHDPETKPATTISHRVKLNDEDEPTDYLAQYRPSITHGGATRPWLFFTPVPAPLPRSRCGHPKPLEEDSF